MMGGGPGYRECRTGTDGSADWKKKECRPGGVRGEVLGGPWGAGGRYPLGLVRGIKYVRTLLRVLRQVRSPVAEAWWRWK